MPNGDGLKNLYLRYKIGDNGDRSQPIPNTATFWESPDAILDTSHGAVDENHYKVNGQPCGILVTVHNDTRVVYQSVTVEAWLCNPATLVAPAGGLALTSAANAPTSVSQTIQNPGSFPLPFPFQTSFIPYPALNTTNNGHLCLIANCFGTTSDEQADGTSILQTTPFTNQFDVLADAHHAQRNVFAVGTGANKINLNFDFFAVSGLAKGSEDVTLEIANFPSLKEIPPDDLKCLKDGPFRHLPLHPSARNPKSYLIHGCHGGPTRRATIRIQAGHPVPLSLELQFDPHESKGAVHAFNVVQKGSNGHVQGGIRVLAVMDH